MKADLDPMYLAEICEEHIEENGLTVSKFCEASGVAIATYRTFREKLPGISVLLKLADYMEMPIDDMIGRRLP